MTRNLLVLALVPAMGFVPRPVPRPLMRRGGAAPTMSADGPKNSAFVFIKPHAVTEPTKELVKEALLAKGLTILSEGSISSEEIDSKQLIDQHYCECSWACFSP